MDAIKADEVIQNVLSQGCVFLGAQLKADTLAIFAPMSFGLEAVIKNEIEYIQESREDGDPVLDRLAVILETGGGYVEAVERIVRVFRKHYKFVDFIIPNYAYSAGTVLVLSGDNIYMNYYSILGPIDPQFKTEDGRTVPGLGYISKYHSLMDTINSVPDDKIGEVRAEMAFLLKKFNPAHIFHIEQSIRHSQELIEQWLPKYKFKSWKKTESGKRVTAAMRLERAKAIAGILGDAEHWHSHGRGISMAELESDKIGLKVEDFGKDVQLNHNITQFHGLMSDFMAAQGMTAAIHSRHRLRKVA